MTVLRRAAMAFVVITAMAALSVIALSGVANADPGIGWGVAAHSRPDVLVRLNALPTTAVGKVDK
jgi:non-ribosomal peptide synthetase component E (peptide arylation enzyme)